MKYRGAMMPDQWPRSVQEDIAQVRASVQQVDADTREVRTAVESMESALTTILNLSFQSSNAVQTGTRTSVISAMHDDLEAVKEAVEDRAAGALIFPLYTTVSVTTFDRWCPYHQMLGFFNRNPGVNVPVVVQNFANPNAIVSRYLPFDWPALTKILAARGVHVVPIPPGAAQADALPPTWRERLVRFVPRHRPVALFGR